VRTLDRKMPAVNVSFAALHSLGSMLSTLVDPSKFQQIRLAGMLRAPAAD
jgi:hypothetical protein